MLIALLVQGCATVLQPSESTPASSPDSGQAGETKAATPVQLTPDEIWEKHKLVLLDIDSWAMKGKMSVKTSRKGGSATVRWKRETAKHDVEIYGPFGGGRVRITEDPFGATLTDSKRNVTIGETAYDVLYEQVGWPVPFDPLKYWVLGLPIPDVWAEWRINETGQLAWLRQAGWEVEFDQYRDRDGIPMPRKLRLNALPGTVNLTLPDGTESDALEVKFVIQRISYENVGS